MHIFLRMKHWELFILFVGLPVLIEIGTMAALISTRDFRVVIYSLPVMMILGAGGFFGWLYALGTNLFKRLPPTATMNLTAFRICFFISVAYLCLFTLSFIWMFVIVSSGGKPNLLIIFLLFVMEFGYVFCIFYCLYFVAKTLKAVEWQRPVTFSDYIGEFFLLWFYFVGVWFIQPGINKLFIPSEDFLPGSSLPPE
jgi:hypothetical protein